MPRQTTPAPETRLSIRANNTQKNVLSRAATARHMNISQFVLDVSLREAQQILSTESRIVVSAEEYDWLAKFMDEPTAAPRLRKALAQTPIWDV